MWTFVNWRWTLQIQFQFIKTCRPLIINPQHWSVCLFRSCQTSPDYSHSSLCPPAGSILRILHIVANIEPLPLLSLSPPAPLRKLWHKYFIVLWTKLHSSLLGGLLQSETISPLHCFLLHWRYLPLKVGQQRCLIFQRNEHYKGFVMSNKRCHYPTSGCGSLHHNVLC